MKILVAFVVIILILSAIAVGWGYYVYSRMLGSYEHSGISLSSQKMNLSGIIIIENNSNLPAYIPSMTHTIYIDGVKSGTETETESFWLGSNQSRSLKFTVSLPFNEIPKVTSDALTNGGTIKIRVDSQISIIFYRHIIKTERQILYKKPV